MEPLVTLLILLAVCYVLALLIYLALVTGRRTFLQQLGKNVIVIHPKDGCQRDEIQAAIDRQPEVIYFAPGEFEIGACIVIDNRYIA